MNSIELSDYQSKDQTDIKTDQLTDLTSQNPNRNKKKTKNKYKLHRIEHLKDQSIFFGTGNEWKNTEFFLPDSANQSTDLRLEYDLHWDWGNFVKFSALHLLYFSILGPFINLVFFRQRILMYNMKFWGTNPYCYVQLLSYTMSFILIVQSFIIPLSQNNKFQFLNIVCFIILRCCLLGCKYATLSPNLINEYHEQYLTLEVTMSFQIFEWLQQQQHAVVQEITYSLMRDNVDKTLFYFQFFYPLDQETKTEIRNHQEILTQFWLPKYQKFQGETFPPKFQLSGLNEQEIYYGYLIFNEINTTQTKKSDFTLIQILSFIFAIGRCSIQQNIKFIKFQSYIFKEYQNQNEANTIKVNTFIYESLSTLLLFYYGYSNYIFLMIGIKELHRRLYLLIQASKIQQKLQLAFLLVIQKTKNTYKDDLKLLPTIDVLCPFSVKSWGILRRLILDYGYGYQLRFQGLLVAFTIYNLIQITFLLLSVLNIHKLTDFEVITDLYDLLYTFIVLMNVLYLYSEINNHFEIHKGIVMQSQQYIKQLLTLEDYYFDQENQFVTQNGVYHELVSRLKQTTNRKQIRRKLKTINNAYQDIIDQLEYDTNYRPYRLLGIKIDIQLIVKLSLAVFSVLAAQLAQIFSTILR